MKLSLLFVACAILGTVRWSCVLPIPEVPIFPQNSAGGVQKSLQIADINFLELRELLERDGAVVIDARQAEAYAFSHIPGAWSVPRTSGSLTPEMLGKIADRARGKVVVVYCSDKYCNDSSVIARELAASGIQNVFVFRDGWEAWEAGGEG